MSWIASLLMKAMGRASARRFEAATRDAGGTQLNKLLEIVTKNAETEYGREFGFRNVKSLADWRAAVPVVEYEDIKARVERVTRGEQNVLTAEDPVMFARTSGTTGDAKYVPVTKTCQGRDHKDQMRTWFHHAGHAHPNIFKGKVLSLVSPAQEGVTPSGRPFGSTSGHIYKNMPSAVRSTYLVPYEVFEVEDYDVKYYSIMRLGVSHDVTFLATANPSSIVKMCEFANQRADQLIRELADGVVDKDIALPSHVRELVQARIKPNPEKARRLEQARARRTGLLLPADYWPNLQLIGCWKGGTVGTYLEKFPGWFNPEGRRKMPVRDWGYLSSEARGSIPISDEGCGGVLTVATNVYEFVAVDDLENAPDDRRAWTFLGVQDIEIGKEYYIFFTTTGGLYRYDINDVVEIVGRYRTTPIIEFRRKGRGMTSITGEKVSVNQVIQAFELATRQLGLDVDHFKAEADIPGSRYVFKAESGKGIPVESRKVFLETLDRNLSRLNIEYEAKRKSQRLKNPVLHVMRVGWYDDQKKKLIRAGKRLFQAKTVLLSTKSLDDSSDDIVEVVDL